jgi:hypothetical protein
VPTRSYNSLLKELERFQDPIFLRPLRDSTSERNSLWESPWELISGYGDNSPSNLNYGLGHFYSKVTANRSPSGKWCRMLWVADRYQFESGNPPNSFPFPDDESGYEIQKAGLARGFDFLLQVNL